jgi:hypothetical protein
MKSLKKPRKHKDWSEMKKTGQDLKVEMESLKKTQTKVKLEMKNVGTQTKTSEASLTNRVQEMEERISRNECKI